ncbi:hypothetical protein [Halalkalibacter akibai]|uniref:Uncharacterized protein n=1 Tax=Halalkalibacter akibai (strain ATCC 43226 / DSM 21942 / CIP 109018 / JCM 9157 / 1139) TaxID=1236973 RepID=W4QZH1_HALA3|nr:hypothetical protein [Halalkalibacter akibai]GAE37525.1 hypothetical protein JCM9157_4834 [Halalkalibacter akibai JCM 9157]
MYEITNMIIDNHFDIEEVITVSITHDYKSYSITFNKSDLEVINTWVFEKNTSFPAVLSESIINSIREDIKVKLN